MATLLMMVAKISLLKTHHACDASSIVIFIDRRCLLETIELQAKDGEEGVT